MDGIDQALVLAGSDKRGTIYSLYDISEQIGVSPWYWWADVPPKKYTALYALPKTKTQGPPSIKYRGLFIIDEQPALTNWIKEKYGGVYNSAFHAKVFELLLRLRANYFWPAMWASKFHVDDNKNGPLADEMGIVMGTSHTEPMARADKEKVKPWDWKSNQSNLKKYMQDGATRSKNWEVVWTLGMRGDGDTASPQTCGPISGSKVSQPRVSANIAFVLRALHAQIPLVLWKFPQKVWPFRKRSLKASPAKSLLN